MSLKLIPNGRVTVHSFETFWTEVDGLPNFIVYLKTRHEFSLKLVGRAERRLERTQSGLFDGRNSAFDVFSLHGEIEMFWGGREALPSPGLGQNLSVKDSP